MYCNVMASLLNIKAYVLIVSSNSEGVIKSDAGKDGKVIYNNQVCLA